MSKNKTAMQYAVVRRFTDNPGDFQTLEYFTTRDECKRYIKEHPHHATDCKLEIARWE